MSVVVIRTLLPADDNFCSSNSHTVTVIQLLVVHWGRRDNGNDHCYLSVGQFDLLWDHRCRAIFSSMHHYNILQLICYNKLCLKKCANFEYFCQISSKSIVIIFQSWRVFLRQCSFPHWLSTPEPKKPNVGNLIPYESKLVRRTLWVQDTCECTVQPGDARDTSPKYFGWGTSMGIPPNIITYFRIQ